VTRARELLRWQPKVPLEDGLKRTIAYFETMLSRNTESVHSFTRRAMH
jgi:UDP-glucuronate decarboxylase